MQFLPKLETFLPSQQAVHFVENPTQEVKHFLFGLSVAELRLRIIQLLLQMHPCTRHMLKQKRKHI